MKKNNIGLIVKSVIAATSTIIGFNKLSDARMIYGNKKEKVRNYLLAGVNLGIAIISAKNIADTLLLPEDDTIPGSMEDISIEKDFIDEDIASEE